MPARYVSILLYRSSGMGIYAVSGSARDAILSMTHLHVSCIPNKPVKDDPVQVAAIIPLTTWLILT